MTTFLEAVNDAYHFLPTGPRLGNVTEALHGMSFLQQQKMPAMTSGIDESGKLDKLFQDQDSEDPEKDIDSRLRFKNYWGVAACLAYGLASGLVPATSRYVQDRGYTAYQMNFFNDLLLLSAILCVAAYHRTNLLTTNYKQVFRLTFNGVGRFLGILCQVSAYRYAPPANAETVINPSSIVFVAILSCIFIKEIPTRPTMFGSLWCIAGVALLGYSGISNKGPSTVDSDNVNVALGIVLAIIAGLIFAMLTVNIKILLDSTPKTMVMTYTYSIATVSAGVATLFTSQTWYLESTTAAVLFANCVSRCAGICFLYAGLKLVEVNAAYALFQTNAFSAYALQWILLGFAPTTFDGFGLTCILIGTFSVVVWEAVVRKKKEKHGKFMKQLDFDVTPPNNNT
ncbi:solute carrier family 35 member G2-like isoform X2 [Branchiostoma lanceolatum]|uniref:solute carrier family 35 member G2-like isoform X2 n=1 Tax=Branchiostoma lanceolatum TaxID=7740 RepID=UPI003452ACDF